MKIAIVDRNSCLTEETRSLAERRMLFALSRFGSKIDRVTLVVEDANGPKGGVDKNCNVSVKLKRLPDIHVASRGTDVAESISLAAVRVGRAVRRVIERSQKFDRRSLATN